METHTFTFHFFKIIITLSILSTVQLSFATGKLEIKTKLEPESITVHCKTKSKNINLLVPRPLKNGAANHIQQRVTDVFSSNYGNSAQNINGVMLYTVPVSFSSSSDFTISYTLTADEKGVTLASKNTRKKTTEKSAWKELHGDPVGNDALKVGEDQLNELDAGYQRQIQRINDEFAKLSEPLAFEYPLNYKLKMKEVGTGSLYRKIKIKICGKTQEFKARVKWKRHPVQENTSSEEGNWTLENFEEGLPLPTPPSGLEIR